MNDPNKRIDVNISSLLSLKAELLRKQAEVNKSKNSNLMENFVPKKIQKPERKLPKESVENKEQTYTEYEDTALLAKSKRVLEAKSKLYDKMISSGGTLNSDENCLVMFNQKQQDRKTTDYKSSSEEENISDDDLNDKYNSNNPDDEWVEYTDCLGRTRKCLRKDLDYIKKKDSSLADNIQPRQPDQESPNWIIDTKGEEGEILDETINDESVDDSVVEKPNAYQMRMQWEKQEKENVNKDYVHYQDILFDEARTHGVGFYEFSTDETERAKQRKDLDTLRTETLLEQKKRDEQKQAREKIIAERVKAAKNRQRARQGLPPEEEIPINSEELYDKTEEVEKREKEKLERLENEKAEKKREKERQHHVRPWDEGKQREQDKEWKYKVEREPMSQEQWNSKKREERPKNFAPIYDEDIEETRQTTRIEPGTKSFNDFRRNKEIFLPPPEEKKSLFFTSKKTTKQNYPKYNEKIVNEVINDHDDDDDDDDVKDRDNSDYEEDVQRNETFAPPPTYDYYGPSSSKHKKTVLPTKVTLEKSIEAGLKFLRQQSDKDTVGSKRKWTTNADY